MHLPPRPDPAPLPRILFFSLIGLMCTAAPTAAATISSRVSDPDGRPVARARVVVSGPIGVVATGDTNESGVFTTGPIAAGRYDVRVIDAGFDADALSVSVAEEDERTVDVRLRISAVAETVVVSASHVDAPLSRTADSVTVITSEDLRTRQSELVADALRLVPGVSVVRSGGRGAITSLFPRGGSSNYTLVLVDGVRANAFGGGYDFAHLSLAGVDRIEVVRDPESAVFGSDAIGAIVHVMTRRGGPPRIDASVEGGSQGTARTTMTASAAHGGWSFGGGAEYARSSGFNGTLAGNDEHVTNDDDHLSQASATVGWQKPNGPDLLMSAHVGRDERGFPGPFGSDPIGAYPGIDRVSRGFNDSTMLGFRFTHPWSSRIRQRVEGHYMDLSSRFTSGFGPSTSGSRRADGRVQEDVAVTSWLGASFGIEAMHERGASSFIDTPIDRSTIGAFAEIRYVPHERVLITGGARVDRIAREGDVLATVNPKVGLSYQLTASGAAAPVRLRASAGTGVRPPDVFELAFTDNPHLRPERSRSVDAGIEQRFARDRYAVSASVFANNYDDLIVTVGRSLQNASQYKSDNVSNARARGVELAADARVAPRLTARANYTFLATEILAVDGIPGVAPPPFKVGDALIRRPRHQGAVSVTYGTDRVTMFADLMARSRVLDVEPNFGAFGGLFFTSGYTVANAGASVRIARGLDVYGRVLNVTDRTYEETLGFPALRRSALVGVRVAAGR